ncbi:MAG: hypothetical protein KDC11_02090, partial [Chitinophagaceae bacterium]|nr:hypothetical protein [Chitinophagaceae bacterium]
MTDNSTIPSKSIVSITVFTVLSLTLYILIGYFTPRTNTFPLLSYWSILFVAYFYIISKQTTTRQLSLLIFAGIVFRCSFLWSIPALSDDYYRFIWDGQVWASGINPFGYLPSELSTHTTFVNEHSIELFNGLNSRYYYSVYPPIMQYIFRLAAIVSPNSILGSVIALRSIILLSEIGTLLLIKRLLRHWNLNPTLILIYVLNPLVIIELTGNLHFEAVVIFFLLWSVYLLNKNKLLTSAFVLALSICTKMIPLLFLPLLIKKLSLKKFTIYTLVTLATSVLLFFPFIDEQLLSNLGTSIALYFRHFEFNASIFYLIREIGYITQGYDVIQTAGAALPIIFVAIYLFVIIKNKVANTHRFAELSLLILFLYHSLALVVHPWYLSTLVVLSLFT